MKAFHNNSISFMALSALFLGTSASQSAILVTPTSAISTTSLTGRTFTSAINGSGLFNDSDKTAFAGTLTTSNITSVVAGAATTFFGTTTYWLSSGAVGDETVTISLGAAYDLTSIYLWNYNRDGGNNNRAIRTFDIAFSTDNGLNYSTPVSAASLGITDFLQDTATAGSGAEAYVPVQTKNFSSTQVGVTNLRFTGIETYGATGNVGIAEIRFAAIPEPSAALLGGLGCLLLLRRRR